MAKFTRSFLKALGLTDEQVEACVEAHVEVTDELKKQRDEYKEQAEKLPETLKELETLKAGEDFKAKFEDEHKAFEAFKADVAKQATKRTIESEYRKLLADERISAKRIDAVIRLTDLDQMQLDKEGHLENTDKLRDDIRREWGEFITETRERGAEVETPPKTAKSTMTREDIFKRDDHGRYVLSTEERQRAIAENPQAFK